MDTLSFAGQPMPSRILIATTTFAEAIFQRGQAVKQISLKHVRDKNRATIVLVGHRRRYCEAWYG